MQAKTVQWTVFSESPSSCAAKAGVTKTTPLIQATSIDFAYDKRKIIDNVSLSIPEHSTTAIVGPSGGGKTTLCHLLARFWDVDKGNVTLDGKDVRDYSMDNLMKNFSFVFQNVYLFHDTIANNIRFGEGYEVVELIDTTNGMFMAKGEAHILGLSGSSLLIGKK